MAIWRYFGGFYFSKDAHLSGSLRKNILEYTINIVSENFETPFQFVWDWKRLQLYQRFLADSLKIHERMLSWIVNRKFRTIRLGATKLSESHELMNFCHWNFSMKILWASSAHQRISLLVFWGCWFQFVSCCLHHYILYLVAERAGSTSLMENATKYRMKKLLSSRPWSDAARREPMWPLWTKCFCSQHLKTWQCKW